MGFSRQEYYLWKQNEPNLSMGEASSIDYVASGIHVISEDVGVYSANTFTSLRYSPRMGVVIFGLLKVWGVSPSRSIALHIVPISVLGNRCLHPDTILTNDGEGWPLPLGPDLCLGGSALVLHVPHSPWPCTSVHTPLTQSSGCGGLGSCRARRTEFSFQLCCAMSGWLSLCSFKLEISHL